MCADLIGVAVGFVMAFALVFSRLSRFSKRIGEALMLVALPLALFGVGLTGTIALLAAFWAGYGYRSEREKAALR